MWTRFNYFVLIEAALIGGKTIFGERQIGIAGLFFGVGLTLVWYVMGAEDRYLVQVYREQVKHAATVLSASLWPAGGDPYHFVGDPKGVARFFHLVLLTVCFQNLRKPSYSDQETAERKISAVR